MGLPQRVFYPVHETAARWGCTVSDIAGWAAMGMLKFVTGIPPIACDEVRIAGLVQIEPADILPMFRRCGLVRKKRTCGACGNSKGKIGFILLRLRRACQSRSAI